MRSTRLNGNLPDFLGIGGARCGSSWLYTNLKVHPELWLPPRKELHYFDRSPCYKSPSHLADESLMTRLLSRKPYNRTFRRKAVRGIAKNIANPENLVWNLRYFLGRYDDEWYATLFEPGKDRIKGEVTPAYSILEREDVSHIRKIMPEAKIIFVMRDPIDRTWSGLRKTELSRLSDRKLAILLDEPIVRSDYVRTISIWRSFFPSEQFYIGFFDDIAADPEDFLLQIFGFLGVSADTKYAAPHAREKTNTAKEQEIPPRIKTILANKFIGELRDLNAMVGGHTEKWLADAQEALQSA